ncbi:MAG: alpha/beta fold hydrolase [Anaerolineae bacterium]|nr:alpha/beta fold hydrolase [Anaerolineae bacterium]
MSEQPRAINLHYAEAGRGPAVVLVHGFPFSHRIWDAQMMALGRNYHVIAPDLRGFGESAAPEEGYGMDDFAGDIVALLVRLGIDRAVWVGHSMGGYITLAALRRWPSRVRAAAFVATHAHPDTPEKKLQREISADSAMLNGVGDMAFSMMGTIFASEVDRQGAMAQSIYEIMVGATPQAVAGSLRGMAARPDSRPMLAELSIPTLVIAGEDDEMVGAELTGELAELIPGAHYVIIPGAGHMPMVEQPDATTNALRAFLETL